MTSVRSPDAPSRALPSLLAPLALLAAALCLGAGVGLPIMHVRWLYVIDRPVSIVGGIRALVRTAMRHRRRAPRLLGGLSRRQDPRACRLLAGAASRLAAAALADRRPQPCRAMVDARRLCRPRSSSSPLKAQPLADAEGCAGSARLRCRDRADRLWHPRVVGRSLAATR